MSFIHTFIFVIYTISLHILGLPCWWWVIESPTCLATVQTLLFTAPRFAVSLLYFHIVFIT